MLSNINALLAEMGFATNGMGGVAMAPGRNTDAYVAGVTAATVRCLAPRNPKLG